MSSSSKRQYVSVQNGAAQKLARKMKGAKGAPFPDFIEPSFATLADKPPSGAEWVHEIKFDGYRFQLHVRDGRAAKMFTRRGYEWSNRVKSIASAASRLKTYAAVLDGEVIVPTPEGRSDFHALEKAIKNSGSENLVYFVFDILYLDGFDLRGGTLLERKEVLKALVNDVDGPIRYSEHLEEEGPKVYGSACEMDLEGVVSKRADGRYFSGRAPNWLKKPCKHRDTFAVVGWAEKNRKFDGIYLGRQDDDGLKYAGKLEHGMSEADKRDMLKRFERLKTSKQPMKASRKFPKAKWIKPTIYVDAEFRGKTGEGLLRHPSFKGIREDY